jgi:hypothetical protein
LKYIKLAYRLNLESSVYFYEHKVNGKERKEVVRDSATHHRKREVVHNGATHL